MYDKPEFSRKLLTIYQLKWIKKMSGLIQKNVVCQVQANAKLGEAQVTGKSVHGKDLSFEVFTKFPSPLSSLFLLTII